MFHLHTVLAVLTTQIVVASSSLTSGGVDASVTGVDPNTMDLILMPDKAAADGAVCLDGSPGGFYIRRALNAANSNNWVLHFKGAGWCYDGQDCLGRSKMEFGSSKYWSNTTGGWNGGILSSSDPSFGSYNKVILLYCDGASFTGDRTEPLMVKSGDGKTTTPLYFRGKRIMDAIISTLANAYGLDTAAKVLLTGCSSGGLASLLHSDYVHAALTTLSPKLQQFRTVPVSGFFLLHDNVDNIAVYPDQMKNVFEMQNSTGGVPQACLAAMTDEDKWKCIFAQNAFAHTRVPTFIENSALDAFQTWCIYCASPIAGFPDPTSAINGNCSSVQGYRNCSQNPEECTVPQIGEMNKYLEDFVSVLHTTNNFHAVGNGGFIHSCHQHCEGLAAGWKTFKINNVSMQDAVAAWWDSDGTDPAAKHTYTPCLYKTTSPYKCNPSCF